MHHTALGAATISLDPQGNLVISNIGSTGLDGVSIDLGLAEGFLASPDIGPAGAVAPGTMVRVETIVVAGPDAAENPGQDQKPMCVIMTETAGGQTAVSAGFDFWNPGRIHVSALLDGVVVASDEHTPPFPDPLVIGAMGTSAAGESLTVANIGASRCDNCLGSSQGYMRIKMHPVVITSFTAGPVTADEIRVSMSELPPGTGKPQIQAAQVLAANVPAVVVSDEAMGMFGLAHRGVGQAHLTACSDCLIVNNIGSSVDDGVDVDPQEPLTRLAIDVTPVSVGETLSLNYAEVVATAGGGQLTASLSLTANAAGGLDIAVDYTALGSTAQTVEVLARGVVIGSISGQTGPVGDERDDPDCIIWDIQDGCSHAEATWPALTAIVVNGLGMLTADELRISPDPPIGAGLPVIESLVTASVTGTDISGFQIIGESATTVPTCTWDCGDGDATVGIVDFLALLGQWGGAGTCDFDGGGVGITDFLALLGNWGPCP